MKHVMLASAVAVFVSLAQPVLANDKEGDPGNLAIEGITRLMDALGAFIASIPQYEAPVMNENGDIIIRRKNPDREDEKKAPKLEETST
ncbi:MAG: hypothetical protein WD185_03710 [Sneathiella sp.]